MGNTLWLSEDEKGKIITKSRVVIKDQKGYNELVKNVADLGLTRVSTLIRSDGRYYNLTELSKLFYNSDVSSCWSREKEDLLRQLKIAKQLITELESSSLSPQSIETILKKVWPEFGFYAVEGLKVTELEPVKRYYFDEVKSIADQSKKIGLSVSDEIQDILKYRELAKTNGQVYSLAKRAYRLGNRQN
ncbi:MAG: hypothetical protein IJB82_04705 [Bacilli bacterium]|nr:hypothetical protein [Bacilli bacterium]